MATSQLPDAATLRQLLEYDAKTGRLFWKARTEKYLRRPYLISWNKKWAGKEAFTATQAQGYRMGAVFGRCLLAHRVIWCMSYGRWPEQVDHIDGDRLNNALNNLREVNAEGNARNVGIHRSNTSGVCGVSWSKADRRWVSQIHIKGKHIHLGQFLSKNDAISARKAAEREYGFHENHGIRGSHALMR